MTEPERAALDHIRRVVDSVLGEPPADKPDAGMIPQPTPVHCLPVPYLSQLVSEKTVNDSGAAAGAMLVRAYMGGDLAPLDFLNQVGEFKETVLDLEQIASVLKLNGVTVERRAGLKLADLALILFSGRPAIVLVRQNVLQQGGLTPEAFDGPHHLVCVGMDMQHVYVHDPLRSDATGENLAIPWLTFYRAWMQAPGMERAALIPRQQLVRRVRVAVETAEVLSEPGDGNAAVGSVAAGDVFEVTAQRDGWGKIGTDRWISLASVMDL
jgi:hypothetical protein